MSRQARKPRRNSLRDVLDAIDQGREFLPAQSQGVDLEQARAATHDFQAVGNQAMCFDAGPWLQAASYQKIPDLFVFPYDVLWVEFDVVAEGGNARLTALCTMDEQHVAAYIVDAEESTPILLAVCQFARQDYARCQHKGSRVHAEGLRESLAGFLSALNCRNVTCQEHQPRAKRQRIRARQGKKPLFSYWTLHLTGADGDSQRLGGTHASPRVHLRRGHPRQYAPGQWTWVQPHAVGSPSRGLVHKDYNASSMVSN